MRARATDERVEIPAAAVFRAIGYRGTPSIDVPFDERRGVIANERGRVRRGEYVVGWAKRGPSGVIGTNKKDANETVDRLLDDLAAGRLLAPEPIDRSRTRGVHPRAPARSSSTTEAGSASIATSRASASRQGGRASSLPRLEELPTAVTRSRE